MQRIPLSLLSAPKYTPPTSFQATHTFAAELRAHVAEPRIHKQPSWPDATAQAYLAPIKARSPNDRARDLIYGECHTILFIAHPTCALVRLTELDTARTANGFDLCYRFDYTSRLRDCA
jgi:hypothetical protein